MVYKLHYFAGLRGMVEPMQLMLTYAGTPFETVRIPFKDWAALKPTYPRGKVPVLEVDGKFLCEIVAIVKFLSDRIGLTPKDPWEEAKALELAASYGDLYVHLACFMQILDKDKQAAYVAEKRDSYATPFLATLEERLGSVSGWVFNELSMADFVVHNLVAAQRHYWGASTEAFPKLRAHTAKLEALPQLQTFMVAQTKMIYSPLHPANGVGIAELIEFMTADCE